MQLTPGQIVMLYFNLSIDTKFGFKCVAWDRDFQDIYTSFE